MMFIEGEYLTMTSDREIQGGAIKTGKFVRPKTSNSFPPNKTIPQKRQTSPFSRDCLKHNGTGGVDAGHDATA